MKATSFSFRLSGFYLDQLRRMHATFWKTCIVMMLIVFYISMDCGVVDASKCLYDHNFCEFSAGIEARGMIFDSWNCSSSGVPITNPCGGDIPAWPGIACDENSLITSISLNNVGLSGRQYM